MLEPFQRVRHAQASTDFVVPSDAPRTSVHANPVGEGSELPTSYSTDQDGVAHVHVLHVDHMAAAHGFEDDPGPQGERLIVLQRLPDTTA